MLETDPFLEFIENFLASELEVGFDEQAISAAEDLSEDQLRLFSSQMHDVDVARHAEMVERDLWTEGLNSADDRVKEPTKPLRLSSAMFTHPYNQLQQPSLDELRRLVLFFNRVAVVVPKGAGFGELDQQRESFKLMLRSYLELKPSVEQDSVELLPMSGFYSNEIEGGAALVREVCDSDDMKPWIASVRCDLETFKSEARIGDPYFDAGIRIISALTYGHRLVATHPFVGRLYHQLFSDDASTPPSAEIAAVQNLNIIHLPGLDALSWEDVEAIRRDEDCLGIWRDDLRSAISSVDPSLPPDRYVERFNEQVQAQLNQSARLLDERLSDSKTMSKFKKGSAELTLSGVAAATVGVLFSEPSQLWQAVCTALKSEGAKQALKFMWESRERSAEEALRSHYAVFRSKNL